MPTDRPTPPVLACPHCMGALHLGDTGAHCDTGHSFDRAREGYLNLLVAGRLATSGVAGDTTDALNARRTFLSANWYSPIADALSNALGNVDGPVLDVGCGEGYYLSHVMSPMKYGIDISKKAVQMASKFLPSAQFAVASAFRLPVLPQSCAAVFTVFAPHSFDEYNRVLQPGGKWVTITPGPDHLMQMRPEYDSDTKADERFERRNEPPAEATSAERVQFTLDLSNDAAEALFSMTPLRWQTAAAATPAQHVGVDVWVSAGTAPR